MQDQTSPGTGPVDDAAASELPRSLVLSWGLDLGPRRGPKPALSATDIAAAAVRIADADGLGAVSMSRVAAECGVTSMALYRYVDGKDDLVDLMLDQAYGLPKLPPPRRGRWRHNLQTWAMAIRDGLLAHPWVLHVPISEPPLTHNQVCWTEAGLVALAGTALTSQQKLSSMLLVDVYARGQTLLALGITSGGRDGDLDPVEVSRRYGSRLAYLVGRAPEQFPQLRLAIQDGSLGDEDDDFATTEFLFGLRTILDGIEALIQRSTGRP